MLESIRKRTGGLLVKSLLGLLVVAFALWGVGDIFQGPRDQAIAEVGGVGIQASALQTEYTRIAENLRRRLGLDAAQARAFGALDDALRRLIDDEAVRQEAAAIGIGAPDNAVLRAIAGNPAFHDLSGRFDKAVYGAILYRNSLTPQAYEEEVRQDIMRAQLVESLAAGAHPPAVAARRLYLHREQRRTVQALTLSDDGADAEPEPDRATLQAWFDERAADYRAPEYRRVTVAVIRPADLLDEVDAPESALREEYEYRIDEFTTPARRAVDQMVFSDRDSAAAARERLAGGADFRALGAELLGLAESDMDLGMVAEDELASPALGEAVFAAPIGEPTEPVETPFGWTVARARDETPGAETPFGEVVEELRFEREIALAQDLAAELGDEFEDARAGGARIEEAARAIGLAAAAVGPVDRRGRLAAGAAGESPPPIAEFLDRAFAADAGEESLLYDTDDGAYYALRVDSVTPPADRRLDEAREQVVADWREQRRRERLAERAAAIAERLRAGESMADVAADTGAAVQAPEPFRRDAAGVGDGLGPAFVAAAFALADGDVSDPIPEGDRAHVARLIEILEADEQDADDAAREEVATRLLTSQMGDIVEGYMGALRRKHGVSVDQGAIQRFFGN